MSRSISEHLSLQVGKILEELFLENPRAQITPDDIARKVGITTRMARTILKKEFPYAVESVSPLRSQRTETVKSFRFVEGTNANDLTHPPLPADRIPHTEGYPCYPSLHRINLSPRRFR